MIEFLLWFVTCFFSTFGLTFFYIKITNATHIFRFKVVFIFLIGVILETLIKFYDVTSLSFVSYLLFYPYLFYVIKPFNFKKSLFYLFYLWLFGLILDIFLMLLISVLNNFVKFDIFSFWSKIIPAFILFFLFVTFAHISFVKKFVNYLVSISCNIKYSDILIIIFSCFTAIAGFSILFNMDNLKISVLLYLLIALIVFIFILLLQRKYVEYEYQTFINLLNINNKFYLSTTDDARILKHNMISKLLSIKSVANRRSKILIDDLISDFNDKLNYNDLISNIPYGFNGIINQKLELYHDKINIKVCNELDSDIFELLTPRKYNVLVEKMSILIDNAIESCLNSWDKLLVVNLYLESDNVYLEIKNTFGGVIDVEKLGNINYSTKGKKRGLGLYSVLRNNEVQTDVKLVNEFFVSRLSAKIKKQY